ncbi:MAG TPA: hydrogenase expression/formation protein HypE [Terriglobales bacterium]|nr:hydrogenase expression/formation protein HypE [Terriglobales bacterium]
MDDKSNSLAQLTCPAPHPVKDTIVLGHGSGGRLSAELMRSVFLPAFGNPVLDRLDDQAVVKVKDARLAFTTDSFVVKPLFFPGGDIGSLAVHGTVNDLAMGGATPLFLSVAFIIEEGLSIDLLRRVVDSLRAAAEKAGVQIVTGDTKVVEKGSGDQLFINTTGIGLVPDELELSANRARPGDRVLLSGSIGEHGIAILAQREGLEFECPVESDSAALNDLVAAMLRVNRGNAIRVLRDPTRGGVSSTLNEIAEQSRVGIQLEESAIRIREEVRGACEMLGLDPLYVANEGKLIAIVAPECADEVLSAMRSDPIGQNAQIIGTVVESASPIVTIRTELGTSRCVDMLAGDQLPRIC